VVQLAEHGLCDDAVPIRDLMPSRARGRPQSRALIWDAWAEIHVRPPAVVVVLPRGQNTPQMALAERDQIVKGRAAGRDQAGAHQLGSGGERQGADGAAREPRRR